MSWEAVRSVGDAKVVAFVVVLVYMTAWWAVALVRRRNDLADVAWGLGFPLIGIAEIVTRSGPVSPLLVLLTCLTAVWGVRLAWHISVRKRGKPEDFRYQQMRERWGASAWWRAYVEVFLLQGLFMLMIASPIIAVAAAPATGLSVFALLGAAVWLAGIVIEGVADAQLAAFLREPGNRGSVLDTGLWSWSRHPNYFGETLLWWGVWIACIGVPWWWAALLGPATITFLLLRVSGVPLLEKRYANDPAYQEYARRTSIFVPLPPRRA